MKGLTLVAMFLVAVFGPCLHASGADSEVTEDSSQTLTWNGFRFILKGEKAGRATHVEVKELSTGQVVFELDSPNISRHYHCCEYYPGNLYVIKRSGDDSVKGDREESSRTTGQWTDELWRFQSAKEGRKIFEAQGLDFRVSPKGDLIAVSHDSKVLFLDPTGKTLHETDFAPVINDIRCKEFDGAPGYGGPRMVRWSKDGTELWGSIDSLNITARFYKIDVPSWKLATYRRADTPKGVEKGWPFSEIALDPESKKVAYSDYPFVFDADTREEIIKSRKRFHLYVHDLETELVQRIATSAGREFNPEWVDAYLLEYDDPREKHRVKLNLDPGCATGIDCDKDTSPVAKLICTDDELLGEDYEISSLFQVLLAVSSDVQTTERGRLAWIAKRNKCRDARCMKRAYQAARQEIEPRVSKLRKSEKQTPVTEEYYDEAEVYADSTDGKKESLGKCSCCVRIERTSLISSVNFTVRFPDSDQVLQARSPAVRDRSGALNFRFVDGWGNWGKGSFMHEGDKSRLTIEAVKPTNDLSGRNVLRQYGEYSLSNAAAGTCVSKRQ